MEKRELYDGIKDLESQTELMLTQFTEVRKALTEVMEENAELRIENQHLHDFINEQKKMWKTIIRRADHVHLNLVKTWSTYLMKDSMSASSFMDHIVKTMKAVFSVMKS
ncbi:Initiation-control protein YabA [Apilactobacillus kunkeei]|nr:Initiation-control protein YabA [Apilactobacillus kunkeei]